MNRGSAVFAGMRIQGKPGFNEAPIHESGKSRSHRPDVPMGTGFNEAPIHESGKFRPCRSGADGYQGFNEAPIHESGKCAT